MATIDRFKEIISKGKIFTDDAALKLDAQLKYDFLAAFHTMEQILELQKTIDERNKKHEDFKNKLLTNCKKALNVIINEENSLKDVKSIDHAIKLLTDYRTEFVKLEAQRHEADKLAKVVKDGVSAGR